MCTYPYHVKHSMKMPTSTQNMSTNIFPYSPFKRHKNSRYFNQQLICSFFIFIVFHFGDTFAIHERKYIVLPFASCIVPAWKPFYPMDDPINIPTFNIFAFTAKCFIPFFAFYTHTHRTLDFSWTFVARSARTREYADIHWIEFQQFCFCCESPRVQLLFICISVCLSVCLCMHIPSLCDRKPITSYGNVFFFARTFRQSFQSIRMCRLCVLCRITSQSVQKQHHISHLQTNLFLFGVFGTQ